MFMPMAHPRVSGENFSFALYVIKKCGSSPRERGKPRPAGTYRYA